MARATRSWRNCGVALEGHRCSHVPERCVQQAAVSAAPVKIADLTDRAALATALKQNRVQVESNIHVPTIIARETGASRNSRPSSSDEERQVASAAVGVRPGQG